MDNSVSGNFVVPVRPHFSFRGYVGRQIEQMLEQIRSLY
jgi:hypothetical protein